MAIACVLIELLPFKIYVAHEWFWWLPIFFTQNWGKHMDLLKLFITSENKVLEMTFCQVSTTIKWLQWEWFSFKVNHDFLTSRYASV